MMSNSPVKEFKVKKLPKNLQPSSLYYVKVEPNKFKIYLTDSKCPPTAYSLDNGGSAKIITSPDGSIQVVETVTETQIQIEASLLAKINSALQAGDIPVFNPSDYDLEEFNNNGADPYAHISEITSGVTNLSYTASPTQGTVNSDTGTDAVIPLADVTNAGLLSPAEKANIATALQPGDITQYTDENAQDAVGNILTDTTTIDFTYDDLGNTILADVKSNSITAIQLADNINISEFVNDSGYSTLSYVDGKVIDSIVDGDVTHAPSRNAVFDALLLKEDKTNKTGTVVGNEASTTLYLHIAGAIAYFQQKLTDSIFGTFITSLTAKTTIVDADTSVVSDSADSNKAKKVTWLNIFNYIKSKSETEISYACSDEASDLTVGTVITFRMPFGLTLTNVKLSLNTAPTVSKVIVDIKKGGVSIFSTLASVDTSSTTSVGASVPAVISTTSLTDDSIMTIHVTQIGSGVAGKGLKVTFLGKRI